MSTHYFLLSTLCYPYFRIARQNRRARRAQARQPRTTFFFLPSAIPTFNGRPLHSVHALLSSFYPLLSLLSTVAHCIVSTHYFLLSTLCYPYFRIARQNRRARRAQARQPRTTFFFLPSAIPTFNGRPLHSVHALLSSFYPLLSLLSTVAHCIVSTHYFLLSTLCYPYFRIARQNRRARRAQARQPRTTFSFLLPTLTLLYPHISHGRIAVRGALKRASHALPSSLSSLLSTLSYVYNTSCFGCRHGQPLWWHQADGSRWS